MNEHICRSWNKLFILGIPNPIYFNDLPTYKLLSRVKRWAQAPFCHILHHLSPVQQPGPEVRTGILFPVLSLQRIISNTLHNFFFGWKFVLRGLFTGSPADFNVCFHHFNAIFHYFPYISLEIHRITSFFGRTFWEQLTVFLSWQTCSCFSSPYPPHLMTHVKHLNNIICLMEAHIQLVTK